MDVPSSGLISRRHRRALVNPVLIEHAGSLPQTPSNRRLLLSLQPGQALSFTASTDHDLHRAYLAAGTMASEMTKQSGKHRFLARYRKDAEPTPQVWIYCVDKEE